MYSLLSPQFAQQPVPLGEAPVWLQYLSGQVRAGFPSPAEDLGAQRIDLASILIRHPQATFLLRARGLSMTGAGIFDGDLLVVDRAERPYSGDIVVAVVDGEFTCKLLRTRGRQIRLEAANPTFPDIVPREGQTVFIWGVVVSCVKLFTRRPQTTRRGK